MLSISKCSLAPTFFSSSSFDLAQFHSVTIKRRLNHYNIINATHTMQTSQAPDKQMSNAVEVRQYIHLYSC